MDLPDDRYTGQSTGQATKKASPQRICVKKGGVVQSQALSEPRHVPGGIEGSSWPQYRPSSDLTLPDSSKGRASPKDFYLDSEILESRCQRPLIPEDHKRCPGAAIEPFDQV